jgi:tetratricopeptide (TPR) repeat protein
LRKAIKLVLVFFTSLHFLHTGVAQNESPDPYLRYEKALEIFYTARRYQSLGNYVRALQTYEEAYLLFQKISALENDLWRSKAERKRNQIRKDVQRLEMTLRRDMFATPSKSDPSKDPQEVLRRFQESRRQEEQTKKGAR